MNNQVKTKLLKLAEEDFKKFSSSLIPNINNVLGVRLPILRKLAKEIANGDYEKFLNSNDFDYMEEIMLQGMVIGLIKEKPDKILKYIKNFVPKIDNWSVCDSFCCGLKLVRKNKKLVWNFLQPYFLSKKEFDLRFGFVMLIDFFVEDEYIDKIFQIIDKVDTDFYYSKMAIAWLISVCYVKFPHKTYEYLINSTLSDWILKKSIQKICESYMVTDNEKKQLKIFIKNK